MLYGLLIYVFDNVGIYVYLEFLADKSMCFEIVCAESPITVAVKKRRKLDHLRI